MGKAVTVLTVLTGAVLIPFQLTEVERARQVAARAAEETRFAEREAQIYKRVEPTRAPPPAASLLPPYSVDIEVRIILVTPFPGACIFALADVVSWVQLAVQGLPSARAPVGCTIL